MKTSGMLHTDNIFCGNMGTWEKATEGLFQVAVLEKYVLVTLLQMEFIQDTDLQGFRTILH